jgi:hypothetical protein
MLFRRSRWEHGWAELPVLEPGVLEAEKLVFGMLVEKRRWIGVWSDVGFGRVMSEESEKAVLMGTLKNTRSRRASVGDAL